MEVVSVGLQRLVARQAVRVIHRLLRQGALVVVRVALTTTPTTASVKTVCL